MKLNATTKKVLQWIFFLPTQILILLILDWLLFKFLGEIADFEITFYKFFIFLFWGGFGMFVLIGFALPALLSFITFYLAPIKKLGLISFIFFSGINQLLFFYILLGIDDVFPFKENKIAYILTVVFNLVILFQMLHLAYNFEKDSKII